MQPHLSHTAATLQPHCSCIAAAPCLPASRCSVCDLAKAPNPNRSPNPNQALYGHALRLLPATPNVYASLASLAASPQEAAALSRVAVRRYVKTKARYGRPARPKRLISRRWPTLGAAWSTTWR